jgi:hypothetical protein
MDTGDKPRHDTVEAGNEAIQMVMWLTMRGALGDTVGGCIAANH